MHCRRCFLAGKGGGVGLRGAGPAGTKVDTRVHNGHGDHLGQWITIELGGLFFFHLDTVCFSLFKGLWDSVQIQKYP